MNPHNAAHCVHDGQRAEEKRLAEQPSEQVRFHGVQRQPWGVLYTATLEQAKSKRQVRLAC